MTLRFRQAWPESVLKLVFQLCLLSLTLHLSSGVVRSQPTSVEVRMVDGNRLVGVMLDAGIDQVTIKTNKTCLLYTSPSPRDLSTSRMPSSA